VRGARPGPLRSPLRAPPWRRRPPAQTLRARRRHHAAAAPASVHARRGPSDGKPGAPPLNTARPSARQALPQWDSARSPGRAFPLACVVPRRPTTPTSTPRCAGFPLAVTSSSPGTPAPQRVTNRPSVPSTRCRPPTSTGTRSGTSSACRTWLCSGVSSTLRTTGSAALMTPAPGATTLCGNVASSSPTTQRTPPALWALETGRSRLPQGSLRAWPRGQALPLGPMPTRS
jgi:hypothetical protein